MSGAAATPSAVFQCNGTTSIPPVFETVLTFEKRIDTANGVTSGSISNVDITQSGNYFLSVVIGLPSDARNRSLYMRCAIHLESGGKESSLIGVESFNDITCSINTVATLQVGDKIFVKAFQDATVNQDVICYFCGFKLAA